LDFIFLCVTSFKNFKIIQMRDNQNRYQNRVDALDQEHKVTKFFFFFWRLQWAYISSLTNSFLNSTESNPTRTQVRKREDALEQEQDTFFFFLFFEGGGLGLNKEIKGT
jgi:hypothetical protein